MILDVAGDIITLGNSSEELGTETKGWGPECNRGWEIECDKGLGCNKTLW